MTIEAERDQHAWYRRPSRLVLAAIFLTGLAVTAAVGLSVREIEQINAEQVIDQRVQAIADDILERFERYGTVASVGGALMNTGTRITDVEWHRFAASFGLDGDGRPTLPGLAALGYAALERSPQSDRRYPEWRAQLGYIRPLRPDTFALLDRDLMKDEGMAEVIRLAIDAAAPRLSRRLNLPHAVQPYVLVAVPVFHGNSIPDALQQRRGAIRGVVLAMIRLDKLVQGLNRKQGQPITLTIYDGPALGNQDAIIFAEQGPYSQHTHQVELNWGGRIWWLEAREEGGVAWVASRFRSQQVFVIGILATLLLTGLAAYQARLSLRAEKLALRMTKALRGSEDELRRHRDTLAQQIEERTRQLRLAKEEAERANRAKTDFLNNMSHELRTPLHAILAFSQFGEKRATGAEDQKLTDYFQKIYASGVRLTALVSDLLDLAKLEAGEFMLNLKQENLIAIISEVTCELEGVAENRQIQFAVPDIEDQVMANVDAVRFAQVIRNLCSNAVKFSSPGSRVAIRVQPDWILTGRPTADQGIRRIPAWRIAVQDQGVGIPEDEVEAIFDKFFQSTKTRTGAGGTGLGLPICRELVHAHRGTIKAFNRPEGGAVFEILIPK
jgi:signal transduction histidine kinase